MLLSTSPSIPSPKSTSGFGPKDSPRYVCWIFRLPPQVSNLRGDETIDVVKILYVIGTLEIGGSERQLVSLVKGLDRSKFSPAVFCLTAQGPLVAELTQAGVKVECFGLRGLRVLRNPGAIARRLSTFSLALRHEQPAIVHGFLFHAYVLGTVAAKLAGVPIVITSRRSLG